MSVSPPGATIYARLVSLRNGERGKRREAVEVVGGKPMGNRARFHDYDDILEENALFASLFRPVLRNCRCRIALGY